MKKNKFSNGERTLLESFEKDQWRSISSLEDEIAAYRTFAEAQVEREKQVNINLSKEDWEGIQKKAHEAGLPSETIIANIVHQFVAGTLANSSK